MLKSEYYEKISKGKCLYVYSIMNYRMEFN